MEQMKSHNKELPNYLLVCMSSRQPCGSICSMFMVTVTKRKPKRMLPLHRFIPQSVHIKKTEQVNWYPQDFSQWDSPDAIRTIKDTLNA